jgi:hypothetical protein
LRSSWANPLALAGQEAGPELAELPAHPLHAAVEPADLIVDRYAPLIIGRSSIAAAELPHGDRADPAFDNADAAGEPAGGRERGGNEACEGDGGDGELRPR